MSFVRTILKVLLAYGLTLCVLALLISYFEPESDWLYTGQLHEAIADADRVVVRDTGYHDELERMDASDVLFEIQDLEEVEAVQRNLVFEEGQRGVRCACIGYPGIDWYRGETLVAETSVQHGRAIRWYEVPGDATLTGKSEEWLVQWLVSNGVPKSNLSLAKDRNSSRQQHVTMVMMLAAMILAGGFVVYKIAVLTAKNME